MFNEPPVPVSPEAGSVVVVGCVLGASVAAGRTGPTKLLNGLVLSGRIGPTNGETTAVRVG